MVVDHSNVDGVSDETLKARYARVYQELFRGVSPAGNVPDEGLSDVEQEALEEVFAEAEVAGFDEVSEVGHELVEDLIAVADPVEVVDTVESVEPAVELVLVEEPVDEWESEGGAVDGVDRGAGHISEDVLPDLAEPADTVEPVDASEDVLPETADVVEPVEDVSDEADLHGDVVDVDGPVDSDVADEVVTEPSEDESVSSDVVERDSWSDLAPSEVDEERQAFLDSMLEEADHYNEVIPGLAPVVVDEPSDVEVAVETAPEVPVVESPRERVIERETIRDTVVIMDSDEAYRQGLIPSRPSHESDHVEVPSSAPVSSRPEVRREPVQVEDEVADAAGTEEVTNAEVIRRRAEKAARESFKADRDREKKDKKGGFFSSLFGKKDDTETRKPYVEDEVADYVSSGQADNRLDQEDDDMARETAQKFEIETDEFKARKAEEETLAAALAENEPVKEEKKRGGLFKKNSGPAYEVKEGEVDPATWLSETILKALQMNASDLHIIVDGSSEDRRFQARIRRDGIMEDYATVTGPPAQIILGRLKAATKLSSSNSFVPEEAIYEINLDGEQRKARIAAFRTENSGEAIVMRLPLTGHLKELDELGFSEQNLHLMQELLDTPSELIMIAGPMGSGKTTSAHGALKRVANEERTVWSIEDPVERRIPGTVQLEINEDNGATFEVLLSKLLRADYNTLFLGEIRDQGTAVAAVRQAKAGRQVMSTIHANNNITALLRLIELAQDSPLSVLDSVRGVVSQRLVRRLNPNWDGVNPREKYSGRLPIHEILFLNDELIEVIMKDTSLKNIKEVASKAKGSTFKEDCQRLIAAGLTDEEEIRRVIGDDI